MKTATTLFPVAPGRKFIVGVAVGLPALLIALPLISADRNGPRAPETRSVVVDRSSHGSVRHADTHVVQRTVAARPEPSRTVVVNHVVAPHNNIVVHRDVEADVRRRHFWDDFAFGRRLAALPSGFISVAVNGAPYFYCNGIYYQSAPGGYEEVYPPVNAAVPEPPDGAIQVEAGGVTYYYAGGAFYIESSYGVYSIVPPPMGVVVPELPPGAVQVTVNGAVAYQFNNIYYEPVFVNGVTQYETFAP